MQSFRKLLLPFTLLAACSAAEGEGGGGHGPGDGKVDDAAVYRLPPELPAWGGSDPGRRSPEAIAANAVTPAFQADAYARVSIPASLWRSQYAPFDDGQTNAALMFNAWHAQRPPVVAVLSHGKLTIRFDRELPVSDPFFELWRQDGSWAMTAGAQRTAEGDLVVEIDDLPGDLRHQLLVSPRGWRDVFPLSFELPIGDASGLLRSLPDGQRHLPGGESVLDPVGAAGNDPYATLTRSSFPAGFINQTPFVSDALHATYPFDGGGSRPTAVGAAYTWMAEQPFKDLYVCLEHRRQDLEQSLGVPSGAGWHHVGVGGESLVHDLVENAPILIGYATDTAGYTLPGGSAAAYGLDRATTYALLQPGKAFTTPRGSFHWYAVHTSLNPCVQIWVHTCVPSGVTFDCR